MAQPSASATRRLSWRTKFFLFTTLLVFSVGALLAADWWTCLPEETPNTYVGAARCISCHQQEGREWKGSHHDLAMDLATAETVLGDFSGTTLDHYGITSRMYRDGDRFMVHTEGDEGKMADFEVKYVFGVEPLQQYMVEFDPPSPHEPGAIGRVQVLRISWDTQRKKWFYLSPPDVDEKLAPDDPLHWTGAAQNWNHMCAECHSTNLKKHFDVPTLTYHTTFSEIDVSCEACHGPGSLHTELAEAKSIFWDRRHGHGLTRMKLEEPIVQIHSCAPCHSRRNLVKTGFSCGANYYDHLTNSLLHPATYYPDGQIRDEVYVFGSFIQSKMYDKGVRCTDCHNAHSLKLKHDDNRLCTSCHLKQHVAAKYDTPAHHFHPVDSTGALCVKCHMLEMPYMDIDLRSDHSFQIPRPDLSVMLQTPNACTACHLEPEKISEEKRGALEYYADWLQAARNGDEEIAAELARIDRWSAEKTALWYGDKPKVERIEFAETLQRAWDGDMEVLPQLIELAKNRKVSGIVRASAVLRLRQYPIADGLEAIRKALKDRDPQVRAAAIPFFDAVPASQRVADVAPLLDDPRQNVRVHAALTLADAPKQTLSETQLAQMKSALDVYRDSLMVNSDLGSSHMAMAILAERLGDWRSAEDAYRRAIYVQPWMTGPRANMAAVLERLGRQTEAAQFRRDELDLMARDAALAPNDPGLQYRLGLGFYLAERPIEAENAMARAVELAPNVPDYLLALCLFYQKLHRFDEAIDLAERLVMLRPRNPMYQKLRADLTSQRHNKRAASRRSRS